MAMSKKKSFNVSRVPLFPFITLDNIAIDNLHLFLRVSDVLVDLLIKELMQHDGLSNGARLVGIDSHKHKYLLGFEAAVADLK